MKIEKSKYQGYLWYSDKKDPDYFENREFDLQKDDGENPFIIEGQLYDGKNSISIKYVDGKYLCKEYELSQFDADDIVKKEEVFYSHRMDGKQLKFNQYWREQEDLDNLCEGMKALQPAELVFVGFKKD